MALAGTYSTLSNGETFPININKNLLIHGISAATTVIDATGSGQNVIQAAGCGLTLTIGELTIQGGNRGIELDGATRNCILGNIINNKITANSTGIFMDQSNINIIKNDISGNSAYGIHTSNSEGVIERNLMGWNGSGGSSAAIYNYFSNSTNLFIINNVIGWNNGSGIENDRSHPIITNNTIAYNYGGSGIANFNTSNPALANNIITSNGVYGIHQDLTSSPTKTYNDVWANAWGDYYGTGGGTGSISSDPRFVSMFDAHLLCSSPAINAGSNSAPPVPVNDFDNLPRPVGGVVDMGAYEKQSDLFCPIFLPFVKR